LASCAERLDEALGIVNDFLDISRLDSLQMQREMESVSVESVLHRSVDVVRPAANDKDVALEVTLHEGLPPLQAAPRRLQQALVNVISNAIRVTRPGGRVQIEVAGTESSVRIEIVDNGVGIPTEDLPHIFDDFYRGRNAEEAGAGLGLSIAKRIILGHGGRIWAESPVRPEADARGSRFVITLPGKASS
jgi:signal transduction histidine kinase